MKRNRRYTLGIDVGIGSVGWALIDLDNNSILDRGVRLFTNRESYTKESLAAKKRGYRRRRKTTHRKKVRKNEIKKYLEKTGFLTSDEIKNLYKDGYTCDVWTKRYEALDKRISNEDIARIIIKIANNRGYKSNRKSEDKNDKDTGKILSSLNENSKLINSYRTVGEMVHKEEKFKKHIRNKCGEYTHTFKRVDLVNELRIILKKQQELGNEKITDDFINYIVDELVAKQRDFSNKDLIESMIGYCTFEPNEKRIARATKTYQIYNITNDLINLRYYDNGEEKKLNPAQIDKICKYIFENKKTTYKNIIKELGFNQNDIKFKHISNNNTTFVQMSLWFTLNEVIDDSMDIDTIDNIAHILTVCKNDYEIEDCLKKLESSQGEKLSEEKIKKIIDSNISFDGFGSLSKKAINELLPHMKNGKNHYEAKKEAGYIKSISNNDKSIFLKNINYDEIRNPVARQSINETIDLINAIIEEYGSPTYVNIELARELSKNFEERNKISKKNKENENINSKIKADLEVLGVTNFKGRDIVKLKLLKEQNGYCMYSGKRITETDIYKNSENYDIDHIIPYSKSFDDSYSNKVLVLKSENADKSDRLPYEYMKNDDKKLNEFLKRVEDNKNLSTQKKNNLKLQEFNDEQSKEFISRNINDTRYITSFLFNHINDNLKLNDINNNDLNKIRVRAVNGGITAYVRRLWGFSKDRKEDLYTHHILDAILIASIDASVIQKITSFNKDKEQNKRNPRLEPKWSTFRDDVLQSINDKDLRPSYKIQSPKNGSLHEETLFGIHSIDTESGATIIKRRISLSDIKFDDNGDFNMFGKDKNIKIYETIKNRYINSSDKKNAFKEPLYYKKNEIKKITILENKNEVFKINDKVCAEKSEIAYCNVYIKDGKYYLVPVLLSDVMQNKTPNKIAKARTPFMLWSEIDDSYKFLFALHKKDRVRITRKDGTKEFNIYCIKPSNLCLVDEITRATYSLNTINKLEKIEVNLLGKIENLK